MKTYTELSQIESFEDRFKYLKMPGMVGQETFKYDRIFNQRFYTSVEWKRIRNDVIIRDNGCDLAHPDYPIGGKIIIHHLNPITLKDIEDISENLINPEYLVCVSHITHNAIHYSDQNLLPKQGAERKPFDTCPWRIQS